MILGELICTLGVGILAPQPTGDLTTCLLEKTMVEISKPPVCDKHDQTPDAVIYAKTGSGLSEQPCKATLPANEKP